MAIPKNIEIFNHLVGLIFADLYANFPVEIEIDWRDYLDRLGYGQQLEGTPLKNERFGYAVVDDDDVRIEIPYLAQDFRRFFKETTRFLASEGFVEHQPNYAITPMRGNRNGWVAEHRPEMARMTAKALAAMNTTPESLDRSAGEELNEALMEAGTEAGKAAVGEVVGRIIGAVAGGFFGGAAS